MTDEGREGQHKSDRWAPSAGNPLAPAAPRAASPAGRPIEPAPSAVTPPTAASPTWTPPAPAPAHPDYANPNRPRDVAVDDVVADSELDSESDEEEFPPTLVERVRRLRPAPVVLTVCSVGAIVFLARAMTSHTTPVPVLLSAGVVSCLVFGIDAGAASLGTWRASREGLTRRALLLSALGGVTALISAGAFAGVLVLVLVLNS